MIIIDIIKFKDVLYYLFTYYSESYFQFHLKSIEKFMKICFDKMGYMITSNGDRKAVLISNEVLKTM